MTVQCQVIFSGGSCFSLTLNILYKKVIYKNVEAKIQDFYYIELRTLLNKVLRLGLEPDVLIKDIECMPTLIQSARLQAFIFYPPNVLIAIRSNRYEKLRFDRDFQFIHNRDSHFPQPLIRLHFTQ